MSFTIILAIYFFLKYISVEYAASDITMPVTGSIQLQYNTAYIQMVLLLVPQYCELRMLLLLVPQYCEIRPNDKQDRQYFEYMEIT